MSSMEDCSQGASSHIMYAAQSLIESRVSIYCTGYIDTLFKFSVRVLPGTSFLGICSDRFSEAGDFTPFRFQFSKRFADPALLKTLSALS